METEITAALVALVGTLMVTVGYMARPRIEKRNGEAERAAVASLTRDVQDVKGEMCGFHGRLEAQFRDQSSLLRDIVGELKDMNRHGVRQRLD